MTNATVSKVTKVQKFNAIKAMLPQVATIEGVEVNLAEFLDNEVRLIQKKSASKVAKTSAEDESAMATIREFLASGVVATPSEIMAKCGIKSTQKATALLKKLADNGEVAKATEGKKVLYALV